MFRQWDSDGDGRIANGEFVQVMRQASEMWRPRGRDAHLNTSWHAPRHVLNTSRHVPQHTLKYISACTSQVHERQGKAYNERRVQAMFGLADLDKNGHVDFEEFVVMQAPRCAPRSGLRAEMRCGLGRRAGPEGGAQRGARLARFATWRDGAEGRRKGAVYVHVVDRVPTALRPRSNGPLFVLTFPGASR